MTAHFQDQHLLCPLLKCSWCTTNAQLFRWPNVEQMDQLSKSVCSLSLCLCALFWTVELAFISSPVNDRLWREDEDEKVKREKMNRQLRKVKDCAVMRPQGTQPTICNTIFLFSNRIQLHSLVLFANLTWCLPLLHYYIYHYFLSVGVECRAIRCCLPSIVS